MKRPGGTLALLALLSGCAQAGDGSGAILPVETLYASGQCGGLERPGLVWITNPADWRSWHERIMSLRVNPPPPPAVDFTHAGVLLIAMGQRPTAGHGLSLDAEAMVRDGILTVRVDWREPPPGFRRAQVMSSPCLLARVPDAPFTHIRVLDREGRVRLEGSR